MKIKIVSALLIVVFCLNGCAIVRPVTQLTGGVLNTAVRLTGAVLNTAGKLAGTALKGAVVAAPFLL